MYYFSQINAKHFLIETEGEEDPQESDDSTVQFNRANGNNKGMISDKGIFILFQIFYREASTLMICFTAVLQYWRRKKTIFLCNINKQAQAGKK